MLKFAPKLKFVPKHKADEMLAVVERMIGNEGGVVERRTRSPRCSTVHFKDRTGRPFRILIEDLSK